MSPLRLSIALLSLAAGCAPAPPAHWAQGGAMVEIPHARWVRGDGALELFPDGKITIDGQQFATLDHGGRLFDVDAQPIALLEPDGRVVGPDDAPMGFVGQASASLPESSTAWIALLPSGELVRFEEDGARAPMGAWVGQCARSARTMQVCTLISHVVALRARNAPRVSVGVGIGIGVGVGGRR